MLRDTMPRQQLPLKISSTTNTRAMYLPVIGFAHCRTGTRKDLLVIRPPCQRCLSLLHLWACCPECEVLLCRPMDEIEAAANLDSSSLPVTPASTGTSIHQDLGQDSTANTEEFFQDLSKDLGWSCCPVHQRLGLQLLFPWRPYWTRFHCHQFWTCPPWLPQTVTACLSLIHW